MYVADFDMKTWRSFYHKIARLSVVSNILTVTYNPTAPPASFAFKVQPICGTEFVLGMTELVIDPTELDAPICQKCLEEAAKRAQGKT